LKFQLSFETEGLLKVTGSDVHCKCGTISELIELRFYVPLDTK